MAGATLTRRRPARANRAASTGAGRADRADLRGNARRKQADRVDVAATGPAGVATPTLPRNRGLDTLRGLAMVAMIAYHACFDLRWFGLATWDFEHDARWIAARSAILGTFMLLAGVSLVLAQRRPDARVVFVRHVLRVAAAALLVTIASLIAFPATFIRFGVLHAIAVSLLIARPLVRRPRIALVAGIVVIVAGVALSHPAFDRDPLGFIGFMTHKPATEDYVPLFPWTGVLLVGVALGHALAPRLDRLAPLARLPRALATMGRHGLLVYLLHQPALVGLLWLATQARRLA
jgi:uncharacterized membrane protein